MPRNVFRRRATRERSEPGVTARRATVGLLEDDGLQAFFNGSIAIPDALRPVSQGPTFDPCPPKNVRLRRDRSGAKRTTRHRAADQPLRMVFQEQLVGDFENLARFPVTNGRESAGSRKL
jgi:hypothetical protein